MSIRHPISCEPKSDKTNINQQHIHSCCWRSTSAARHRQLVKLLNNTDKAAGSRALTPTPPGRAMTPTPPDRPKSEAGTGWSRSRSRSQAKGRSCLWKLACDKNCIGNAGFAADGEKWRRKLKFLGDNFILILAIDYDKP